MIPGHCKSVSIRNVAFPLTVDDIGKHVEGKKAYTRTEYLILRNGEDLAVIRIEKENGVPLFRPITHFEIVSLPPDTIYVEDQSIDVLNASQMAKLSREHEQKTVVVSGMFNHVSFVKDERGLELRVMDVVPPYPSKLAVLVEKALDSFLIEFPVVPMVEHIDLNDFAKNIETPGIIFPCRASGITTGKSVHFLDETPQIVEECTLVGCDLSRRIFSSTYRKEIVQVNMCPRDLAPKDGFPRIVKCCKIKEGYELDGSTAIVPWGATVKEVAEAVRALLNRSTSSGA
ncbi:MAG: hypothetical protein ABSB83_01035 [Methanomassiliicoccales archaeon]